MKNVIYSALFGLSLILSVLLFDSCEKDSQNVESYTSTLPIGKFTKEIIVSDQTGTNSATILVSSNDVETIKNYDNNSFLLAVDDANESSKIIDELPIKSENDNGEKDMEVSVYCSIKNLKLANGVKSFSLQINTDNLSGIVASTCNYNRKIFFDSGQTAGCKLHLQTFGCPAQAYIYNLPNWSYIGQVSVPSNSTYTQRNYYTHPVVYVRSTDINASYYRVSWILRP